MIYDLYSAKLPKDARHKGEKKNQSDGDNQLQIGEQVCLETLCDIDTTLSAFLNGKTAP